MFTRVIIIPASATLQDNDRHRKPKTFIFFPSILSLIGARGDHPNETFCTAGLSIYSVEHPNFENFEKPVYVYNFFFLIKRPTGSRTWRIQEHNFRT